MTKFEMGGGGVVMMKGGEVEWLVVLTIWRSDDNRGGFSFSYCATVAQICMYGLRNLLSPLWPHQTAQQSVIDGSVEKSCLSFYHNE